jgi:hypothetical protein
LNTAGRKNFPPGVAWRGPDGSSPNLKSNSKSNSKSNLETAHQILAGHSGRFTAFAGRVLPGLVWNSPGGRVVLPVDVRGQGAISVPVDAAW